MNSMRLIRLHTEFLTTDPQTWEEQESYAAAKRRLSSLKVVNDTAERGVALIQDYNKTLTKDEGDLQFLLQVAADHRHQYPVANTLT